MVRGSKNKFSIRVDKHLCFVKVLLSCYGLPSPSFL